MTDAQIVTAIILRNALVTKEYLFRVCYPLFKSVFDKYYTDCNNCLEFINEIYLYIMMPSKKTGTSKLQGFGFRCSLTMWLKVVTENYCHQIYSRRGQNNIDSLDGNDRFLLPDSSLNEKMNSIDMEDLTKMLNAMPNSRYRQLIEYRYIDDRSNEETALLMGITMANYYNVHKRAKEQFAQILRKEGLV